MLKYKRFFGYREKLLQQCQEADMNSNLPVDSWGPFY